MSAATKDLTGLTPGTTYTYTAYNDDPRDFGTPSQYPILKYSPLQNVTQR